jgi:hypothetical protein
LRPESTAAAWTLGMRAAATARMVAVLNIMLAIERIVLVGKLEGFESWFEGGCRVLGWWVEEKRTIVWGVGDLVLIDGGVLSHELCAHHKGFPETYGIAGQEQMPTRSLSGPPEGRTLPSGPTDRQPECNNRPARRCCSQALLSTIFSGFWYLAAQFRHLPSSLGEHGGVES